MTRTRRSFTAERKAQVVRRHLRDKVPVSQLAEELSLQPSQIHNWVNQVLAQAEKAFHKANGDPNTQRSARRQIEELKAKLVDRNEVIAELMEENVKAKKAPGEL